MTDTELALRIESRHQLAKRFACTSYLAPVATGAVHLCHSRQHGVRRQIEPTAAPDEGLLELTRGRGIRVVGTVDKAVILSQLREFLGVARANGYERSDIIEMIQGLA